MKTGTLPWVPEDFRFPVLVSSAHGRRKTPRHTREKTSGTQGAGTFAFDEKYPGVRLFCTFKNR